MKSVAVVIPAMNEEQFIAQAILGAKRSGDFWGGRYSIVVLANNCSDRTVSIVEGLGRSLGSVLHLHIADFPRAERSAGTARRTAVAAALADVEPDVVLSTDADAILTGGTIAAVMSEVDGRADIVCGQIETTLPPVVANAPSILRIDAITARYMKLVHELRFALDLMAGRQSHGTQPHYIESAACLAARRDALEILGGFPAVPSSEDRVLVRAAERAGMNVRYSEDAAAVVSSRLWGRAQGGMAETIRHRLADRDPVGDAMMIPAGRMKALWDAARDGCRPFALPERRDVPMRASQLEREYSSALEFVSTFVRPWIAEQLAPADAGAAVA
jgi:cellulose synthase/poly-beta-1,6-N-acetylglucosamine synthase-like glycosyltransferase